MESVEKAVAKSLMEIKAVMLRPDSPFTWASGWKSPIYCDNRRILSYPAIRENVCNWMADIIRRQYPEVEVIAGVATGAIAHGYLVAHILGKPFCYVRPKPKDHGTGLRPVSQGHSRRGFVGASTLRSTPISRSPLDKNPMPGHLSELHPVNEVNTKGQ